MDLLFVCTGNACRSPLAERLFSAWQLRDVGAARRGLEVASGGTDALDGRAMDAAAAQALVELGGDPAGFESRHLDIRDVQRAGLILTMTREQRTSVLNSVPAALRRTFTLAEAAALVPLADLSGLESVPLAGRPGVLAHRLSSARSKRSESAADDIRDPIGRSPEVHRAVAGQIADALRPLTDALLHPEQLVAVRPERPDAGATDPVARPEPLPRASMTRHVTAPEDDEPPRWRSVADVVREDPRWWLVGVAAAALVVLLVGLAITASGSDDRPAIAASPETPSATRAPASLAMAPVPLPADPRLLILGDSYTAGVGAEPQAQGWAYQAAVQLGWRAEVQGFPGSGFTTASDINPRTFAQRIPDLAGRPFVPDVLVLQGGDLDAGADPAAISSGVQQTVTAAQAAWPGVQVVVVGILAPELVAADLTPVNDAERAGATAAGVPFIDPVDQGWFTPSTSGQYVASDGIHLNNPGYTYVALRFVRALQAVTTVG